MRKNVIAATTGVFLLGLVYFVSSYGFIEVAVESPGGENITYSLFNQKSQKTAQVITARPKIKKLVRKGNWEVLVSQNGFSYFSVIKSGGWLGKTPISARLQPEKHREFVGNNPGPCMYFTGSALLSGGCDDFFSRLQVHIPATSSQPTTTREIGSDTPGFLSGIAKTSAGNIAFIYTPEADEEGTTDYSLYPLTDDARLGAGVTVNGLDNEKLYKIQAYDEGFIIYDEDLSQVLYFASLSAAPVAITLQKPADPGLLPYLLAAQGKLLLAAYSNGFTGVKANLDEPDHQAKGVKSEIIIHLEQTVKRLNFNRHFSHMQHCGQERLCALNGDVLEVYETSAKPKKLFSLTGVQSFESTGSDELVVFRQDGVLVLNLATLSGHVEYSLGDYGYCGSRFDGGSYTLCLSNHKNELVALRIDRGRPNNDSIDKKVAQLLRLPEVDEISTYGSFIFITPNLGELVYDSTLEDFVYDPAAVASTGLKINQEVDRLGISRDAYKIINVSSD